MFSGYLTIDCLSSFCMVDSRGFTHLTHPRSNFRDVALHESHNCRNGRPYRDAQDRLLWRDKTYPARERERDYNALTSQQV